MREDPNLWHQQRQAQDAHVISRRFYAIWSSRCAQLRRNDWPSQVHEGGGWAAKTVWRGRGSPGGDRVIGPLALHRGVFFGERKLFDSRSLFACEACSEVLLHHANRAFPGPNAPVTSSSEKNPPKHAPHTNLRNYCTVARAVACTPICPASAGLRVEKRSN